MQYWRRRFFRLNGTKLTAYHEMTRQPRAGIDLSKAAKLIDDKTSLVQPDGHGKSGKSRRRSAFGEEEEGYMFVEEGFRIRFANGEVIDFYADNRDEKEGWMAVLAKAVGKESKKSTKWCEMVLSKERLEGVTPAQKHAAKTAAPATSAADKKDARPKEYKAPPPRTSSAVPRSAPQSPVKQTSPVKPHREAPMAPMMSGALNTGRHSPALRQGHSRLSARRQQVKSMLF